MKSKFVNIFWSGLVATCLTGTALAESGYRSIPVDESSVPTVHAALRYTTVLVFPHEKVVADDIGDGAEIGPGQQMDAIPTWILFHTDDSVSVKPTLKGARTDLVVRTKDEDGKPHTYGFNLAETGDADIKIVVERKASPVIKPVISADPSIALTAKLEASEATARGYQTKLDVATAELQKTKVADAKLVDPGHYVGQINADYKLDKHAKEPPFSILEIFNDSRWTYIKCSAREPFSVYEYKDKKPSLVQVELNNVGLYTIPKIVDHGLVRVGKKEAKFNREGK